MADPARPPHISGAQPSVGPLLSQDGRYVVFLSAADNLVTNDHNAVLDLFLRDRVTRQTTLVSLNALGTGSGNGHSTAPVLSTNGQWIAFQSAAEDLVTNDSNLASDIFVRDWVSGQTRLISANESNTGSANGESTRPQMTPDGRWIAFESSASNLVAGDTNQNVDVFLRDSQGTSNILISVNADGVNSGNGYSSNPSLSADGRYVAFESTANNLVSLPTNTVTMWNVYVRDVLAGTTLLVSANAEGTSTGNSSSRNPVISADGRYIAFESTATNLIANTTNAFSKIFRYDLQSKTLLQVSGHEDSDLTIRWNVGNPVISSDGRWIAYEASYNVFLWDAQTGVATLISVGQDGISLGNGTSFGPQIGPAGQWVVFTSNASNLVAQATNGQYQVYFYQTASRTHILISVDRSGNGGSGASVNPVVGADGRFVGFESGDDNLVEGDDNAVSDVFIRDLEAGTTELISQRHETLEERTPTGTSRVYGNALSADGRGLVFSSTARHLVSPKTSGEQDLFFRDLAMGTTALVSVNQARTQGGNGPSSQATMSADRRYVAFQSKAGDLVANDINNSTDIFLWDAQTGSNALVSVNTQGLPAGKSDSPQISPDGRYVVFLSAAKDLVNPPLSSSWKAQLFARDLFSGTNLLLSTAENPTTSIISTQAMGNFSANGRWLVFAMSPFSSPSGARIGVYDFWNLSLRRITNTNTCVNPRICADGSRMVYETPVTSSTNRLYVYDLTLNTNILTSDWGNNRNASLSADGRYLVFESNVRTLVTNPLNNAFQVFVRDLLQNQTTLISVNREGTQPGQGSSFSPLISADGRYVVFQSRAADLVDNDTNGLADIFVRDRAAGVTFAITAGNKGSTTDSSHSTSPVMSADGRTVAFMSWATEWFPGDFNKSADVFVLRLGSGDSDQDGMDDDWEWTYFGNLDRDGKADYDGDGLSDRAEFVAGTNPINDASVLRVFLLTSVQTGGTWIYWHAVAGKSYTVQYKNALTDPEWSSLAGTVMAEGPVALKLDDFGVPTTQRYYRVRVSP
jgi:Tol biopolymer transport system component